MIKDLDRITKLGYDCEIIWNKQIHIYLDLSKFSDSFGEPISVLTCFYDSNFSLGNFEQYVIESCNIFYSWYNKNGTKLINFLNSQDEDSRWMTHTLEKIEKMCLGDVTKNVVRQIKIDDVVDNY